MDILIKNEEKHSGKKRKAPIDSLLDKLTHPKKKAKQKAHQEKLAEEKLEKLEKMLECDKNYAKDCFNDRPTAEQLQLWKPYVLPNLPKPEELQELWENAKSHDMIGYVRMSNLDGLYCILDFVSAADHCMNFLEQKMPIIGWSQNMTNYHPVVVSNSTPELLLATFECYKMMIKQMQRFQESNLKSE